MRRTITVLVTLTATFSMGMTPIFASDQPDETVVIVNYDPSPTVWTRGSLAIVMRRDGTLAVGLDFNMPNGRLERLVLSGSHWTLDVSKEVSTLDYPYPLRAQAYVHKIDDTGVHEFGLALPFGKPGEACQEMVLEVVNGQLTHHEIGAANEAQCEP
jgi:hypothetical protein